MDDLPFTPVELVAIDPARNVRRRWRVTASRDLFGQVVVETGWGRIGAKGRTLVRSFADEKAAHAYVRGLFARRAGALRRIGVAYRPLSEPRIGLVPARAPRSPAPEPRSRIGTWRSMPAVGEPVASAGPSGEARPATHPARVAYTMETACVAGRGSTSRTPGIGS